jgi:hypothetical protein
VDKSASNRLYVDVGLEFGTQLVCNLFEDPTAALIGDLVVVVGVVVVLVVVVVMVGVVVVVVVVVVVIIIVLVYLN